MGILIIMNGIIKIKQNHRFLNVAALTHVVLHIAGVMSAGIYYSCALGVPQSGWKWGFFMLLTWWR